MAYSKIHNKGDWRHEEAVASKAITPGMLCQIVTDGRVQFHSTQGGRAERLVAYEDALQGGTVDTAYAVGGQVMLALVEPGTVMNMLIAAGQNADPGEEVISNGDGTLIVIGSQASAAINVQVIGRIDASEAAFTTLAANTLKAVRFV